MGQFTYEAEHGHDLRRLTLIRHLGGGIALEHARGSLGLTEAECRWLLYDALPGLLARIAEEPS